MPIIDRCPNCRAPLGISLTLETDFTKTKEILDAQASIGDLTNEQLAGLPWKQSQKKQALSTLLVTAQLLQSALPRYLYDRLKMAAGNSWKIDRVTYKLSANNEGTEWLQRWQPIP